VKLGISQRFETHSRGVLERLGLKSSEDRNCRNKLLSPFRLELQSEERGIFQDFDVSP
jgi:hypothetical protein